MDDSDEKKINLMKDDNDATIDSQNKDQSYDKEKNYQTFPPESTNRVTDTDRFEEPTKNPPKEVLDTLDQLIDIIGLGPEQIKIILVVSTFKITEGFHMALFSHIIIPFERFYVIGEYVTIFISSVIFIGFGLGALLPGYLSKVLTRRLIAVFFSSALFILSLFQAMFENFYVFGIVRFSVGLCFGILKPIFFSLLVEYLPSKYRALVICSEQFFFLLGGTTIMNMIMRIIMPNLKIEGLKMVLFTIPIPALFLLFFCIAFVKDSPRHLFEMGKSDEAIRDLEIMSKRKFTEEHRRFIIERSEVRHEGGTLRDIFQRKLRRIVAIVSVIFVFNAYLLYCVVLISSISLKSIFLEIPSEVIVQKQTMIFWILLPGCIAAAFICEIPFFGRKGTIILGFAIFSIFGLVACIFQRYFDIFLGLMGFFLQLNYNIAYVYACEAFPTKIRGVVLGFFVFWTRLSGFGGHYLLIFLHNVHYILPYGIAIAFSLIGVIIGVFLPYDTLGRSIEEEVKEEVEEILRDAEPIPDGAEYDPAPAPSPEPRKSNLKAPSSISIRKDMDSSEDTKKKD